MRALRWAGASLLLLLSGLLGLVGLLLCATLLLLPLGIPILFLARRLFRSAGQLAVPRAVRHPIEETQRRAGKQSGRLRRKSSSVLGRGPSPSAGTAAAGKAVRGAATSAGAAATAATTSAASRAKTARRHLPGRRTRTARFRRKLHLT